MKQEGFGLATHVFIQNFDLYLDRQRQAIDYMENLCSKGVRDFASAASIHVSESCGLPTQLSPPSSLQYPTLPTSYVQRCLTSLQGVETWSLDQQCQAVALAFLVSQLLQETQDRGRFDGGNIKPGSDPTDRSFPFLSGIPRQK